MKIDMKYIPKSPIILEGFPGFGLVGTIATEFLIEHLKANLIGEFVYDDLPATLAIHKGKLVKPMAVFHDKKNNIVILHTILNTKGFEWEIADAIIDLVKKMKAKEVISIEGVGSMSGEEDTKLYSHGNPAFVKLGAAPVQESIIMGVSAAIMLRYAGKMSCLFAGTHSQLPDSKAAAKIIEILDKYLKLDVDYHPLLRQAEEFEEKLKGIMAQSAKTVEESDKKTMSYLG
ncbi:MAG: PAC2 family protein [Nanoarchaeota archaeon]